MDDPSTSLWDEAQMITNGPFAVKVLALRIFGLSLVAHLLFSWLLFEVTTPRLGTSEHREIALNLLAGNGFVRVQGGPDILWRPPLYSYLLAGVYALFGDWHAPVIVLQAVFQAATAALVIVIGAPVFGRRPAVTAALALTLYPLFLYNGVRVMTESVFTLLLALLVWRMYALQRTLSTRESITVGLLLGVATLCKASTQFLPYVIIAAIIVPQHLRRLRAAAVHAALILLPFFALVSIWTVRNYVVTGGDFILVDTSGGYTLWVGNHLPTGGFDDDGLSDADRLRMQRDLAVTLGMPTDPASLARVYTVAWGDAGIDRYLGREAIRSIVEHPWDTLLLWARKPFRLWFHFTGAQGARLQFLILVMQGVLLAPVLAGAYLAWRDRRWMRPMVIVLGYFVALHTVSTANVRYAVPLMPYTMLLAAYAGEVWWGRRTRARPSASGVIGSV